MAFTLGTGTLTLLTLGVAATLVASERPEVGARGRGQDLEAPAVPEGITARLVDGSSEAVHLSWEANHSDADLTGYVVYRSTRPEGGYEVITTGPVLTNAYVDPAAPTGQDCYYRVSARDADSNESALSAWTGVRTPASAAAEGPSPETLRAGF